MAMESIRKWFYRPKRDDTSLLAQFFYADESLNAVACELDSFDGRQEPERCTTLVNQLRHCQDKVLTICNQIMDELIPDSRANRDFRVKFPDDVMQENLAGQLWFGAECLAAGSSIMNREAESSAMRPLAKALTKSLELVRNLLREHALKGHMNLKAQNQLEPSIEKLIESLKIFDRLFADFELCYVGAMVPVKSTKEYEQQELVCVLFSETLQRALERGLLSQSDVDNYEPALMFTIPRLAIVAGLLAPPGGPLCLNSSDTISEMFRPFRNLLLKIRELLWTLNNRELYMLEKLLCSNEEPTATPLTTQSTKASGCQEIPDVDEFVHNFYTDYPNCKDFIVDFYTITRNTGANMDETANDAVRILDEESGRIEYLIERRLQPERREKRGRRGNKPRSHRESARSASTRGHAKASIANEDRSRVSNCREERIEAREDDDSRRVTIDDSAWIRTRDNESESSSQNRNYDCNADNVTNNRAIVTSREATTTTPTSTREISPDASPTLEAQTREDFTNPDITRILGSQTDTIEIPQTQYLLNQVSHENQVTVEAHNIESSLPDMDSQKLISEANKTLSSLLLETASNESHNNEISEQTDSGICTVISSENTSLYDKSPEEKKSFANELTEVERRTTQTRDEDNHENTSYSCSSLNSSRRDNDATPEAPACVCNNNRATWNTTDTRNEYTNNRVARDTEQMGKTVTRISSSFNGTSEEFVGIAYGNGQISVCDSNPSTLQINYSENWEALMNRGIDRTTSTRNGNKPEFTWSSFECKNCPSTSQRDIAKIGDDIERYARVRIAARRGKEAKPRKRHQRKFERRAAKRSSNEETPRAADWSFSGELRGNEQVARNTRLTTASSESSRSNSIDRCINPRLVNFGASLHPSRNTRQMPNFGGQSPQPSPRLCHLEARADTSRANGSRTLSTSTRLQSLDKYAHNRKLLDHRRSRSEQIARMKRTTTGVAETKRSLRDEGGTEEPKLCPKHERNKNAGLMNDGLGPRTDKSGLPAESPSPPSYIHEKHCALHSREMREEEEDDDDDNGERNDRDNDQPRGFTKAPKLARTATPKLELSLAPRRTPNNNTAPTSSSCSSCCESSSSETSEFQSDCQDDEEIALAMQAAEIANRNQIRAKFRSSEDLVHRLFVCIAGVADQLQTNFASDLRNILKCVFLMNSSQIVEANEDKNEEEMPPDVTSAEPLDTQTPATSPDRTETSESMIERQDSVLQDDDEDYEETTPTNERSSPVTECGEECVERAPAWVPDNDAPRCMACQAGFTVVRRRHHCRNCGKVFCGRCSSNNVPLPRYGHTKPVRVCNRCFIYQVMPFTVSQVTTTS